MPKESIKESALRASSQFVCRDDVDEKLQARRVISSVAKKYNL